MSTNLHKLYDNKKYSDVTLELASSSQTIHANKSILAIHSKLFETLFFNGDNSPSSYRVKEQEEEVFLTMVKFIYTGEICVDDGNVFALRDIAKEYGVLSLEEKCEEFFAKTLTLDNVFGFLEKAEKSSMPKLLASCLLFVCKNARKIFAENKHFSFGPTILATLLQRDDLRMKEVDLFKSVIRYCDARNPDDKDKSVALAKQLSPHIRYQLIPMKDLMQEVFPLNILSMEERLAILEQQVLSADKKLLRKSSADVTYEIKKNIDFAELVELGWKVIYQHPFSHSCAFDEFTALKEKYPDSEASICCMGKKANSNEVPLAAFGPLKQVLTPSDSKTVAKQIGEVYWYFVRSESFGFAEASNISLGSADTVSGDQRMSWHLSGGGGYRLGDNTNLNSSTEFEKVLMMLEE